MVLATDNTISNGADGARSTPRTLLIMLMRQYILRHQDVQFTNCALNSDRPLVP